MNPFLGILGKIIAIPAATLAGNWVGGQLRFWLTGETVQTIVFKHTTPKGQSYTNSPVATKFYPGLLFSLLGKPRWLFALIGGIIAGAFVPDHFEHYWLERVIEPYIVDRYVANSRVDGGS